ncbi:MAG TPA: outer membrane beta-barrel protein, partial [Gammaproteobacteria bacterium]|nr:outer membrane beta-barrel protein [Gammaproteobacteria bacterium]
NEVSSPRSYKGEAPAPIRTLYKGEEETSHYVPQEGKYGGQVFTSELYQGPIEGPGYLPENSRDLHDGFYMGVAAGYDSYKMRSNIDTLVNGVSVFQQNPELNAVGLSYTLLGGFGRVFDDPLYLGFEFFYNYSRANTSQNVGIFNGQEGIYYLKSVILGTYGASFLPGIKLGRTTLLFLKGGYTRVDVKTYETSAILGINNAQSNGSNGINFGLGLEADIYKNWSIRGEYTHVNFESFSTRLGTEVTPSNNQFMFAVIVHFI